MPLAIADAGPPRTTPGGPVSARAPDRAAAGADTVGAGVGEAADAVAISATARARQALDASVLDLQRLGSLLERLNQATCLAAPGDPVFLIGLAAEVGAAAREVGLSFAAKGDIPGPIPAEGPELPVRVAVTSVAASALSGADAAALQVLTCTSAPATARPVSPLLEAPPPMEAPPPTGCEEGHGGVGAGPARHAGRGSVGPLSAAYAPASGEAATVGSTWEATIAVAVALLHRAATALVLVKLRLAGIPAPEVSADGSPTAMPRPAMMADLTRCEAQIALAMAQVAGSHYQADEPGQARSGWRGRVGTALARCGAGSQLREEGEQLRLARAGFVAVLLCAAIAALWVATTLDLMLARIACALIAGVLCAAGAWRAISVRAPRSLSVAVEPDTTP